MQRNKYLEDLGLPIEKYGTNFMSDKDKRNKSWKKQKKKYGFDTRETWNLDVTLAEWIYSRLMMYKEQACIDLDYHKIKFKGKEYTQGEAIDYIIECAKNRILHEDDEKMYKEYSKSIHLLGNIIHDMWW